MKYQQVNVDFWAMFKSMFMYIVLSLLGWLMFKLFNSVVTLPRQMRAQQDNIQATLAEFQRRYPNLKVTEEELREAEKEVEKWRLEYEGGETNKNAEKNDAPAPAVEEDKKSI